MVPGRPGSGSAARARGGGSGAAHGRPGSVALPRPAYACAAAGEQAAASAGAGRGRADRRVPGSAPPRAELRYLPPPSRRPHLPGPLRPSPHPERSRSPRPPQRWETVGVERPPCGGPSLRSKRGLWRTEEGVLTTLRGLMLLFSPMDGRMPASVPSYFIDSATVFWKS